jgi:preprotein translocase subunit SecE
MCAMDVKVNPSRANTDAHAQHASKKGSRLAYVRELKEELRKVSWTTKDELKLATKLVVGTTFLFGLGIYLADLIIKGALDLVSLVVHFIFG